jgi:glycosyltransferase involved in cell wall biosynthesis
MAAVQERTPRFSIVSAVYNVARYLDEFIDSIERQTFPLDHIEVVMVDDGSTDESPEILRAWQQRRPEMVKVITKPNGGQGSARNAALEHVRGEWVTYTDPDDVLAHDYLAEVAAFLDEYPSTMLVATNRVLFSDRTRQESPHPLQMHFVEGVNHFRNLNYDTGHFHGSAPASFFRTEVLKREHLRFDDRLRASFEDGHFCSVYLLRVPEPLVGFLSTAVYKYRKRDDGSSTLDRSWLDPGRFTNVLEFGYLDLLRAGVERHGRAPSWLQGMVLYELSWYFALEARTYAPSVGYGEVNERFHELFEQICLLLDETGVNSYYATEFPRAWREILSRTGRAEPWHTAFALVDRLDTRQKLMRVTYRFTGELPEELFTVYGKQVEPVHQKIRDIRFFGRTMLHERIVWLPFGTARVVLDGIDLDVRTRAPDRITHRLNETRIEEALDPASRPAPQPDRSPSVVDRAILKLARSRVVRRAFRDAWVLIDRIRNADDSAEHLFIYLRENRPTVNAWFVIARGTPDYKRLRRVASRRVVRHGSLLWKLLMLNCQHLISSHVDESIVVPPKIDRIIEPRWRVTFLQHGVGTADLSVGLNRKNIDLFVTSTRGEHHSIVDDHTAYTMTSREAQFAGLPRFDRLREEANLVPAADRDLLLIAPAWRPWLSTFDPITQQQRIEPAEFASSQFAAMWTSFANSPELRELAERAGLTVALLLHPALQAPARLDTEAHVKVLPFERQNVQQLFARARVLVTDYSAISFDAAYIERPIVYFQFDRDRALGSWRVGRRGYYDYERDGFGPVTITTRDAVAATINAIEKGPEPEPVYLERINLSFPSRDGRCCERVADAIATSTKAAGGSRRRASQAEGTGGPGEDAASAAEPAESDELTSGTVG